MYVTMALLVYKGIAGELWSSIQQPRIDALDFSGQGIVSERATENKKLPVTVQFCIRSQQHQPTENASSLTGCHSCSKQICNMLKSSHNRTLYRQRN
jgi:hypothetical protein